MSAQSGEPAIVREAGTVESILDDDGAAISLQETSDAMLELAEQTGLGPLTLRRLIAALGRADHKAVTAQQLSDFYGVMPRSARRMLGLLVAAGYTREAGVRAAAAGAGRPHVVYEVDLPGLRQIMATSAGAPPAADAAASAPARRSRRPRTRHGARRCVVPEFVAATANCRGALEFRSNNGYSARVITMSRTLAGGYGGDRRSPERGRSDRWVVGASRERHAAAPCSTNRSWRVHHGSTNR